MQTKLTPEMIHQLSEASNYKEFLSIFIKAKSNESRRYTYADLARSSGFSSRSFIREVIIGKKTLTPSSLQKIVRGLNLSKELTQLFIYLVELEIEECRAAQTSLEAIKGKLRNLRSRLSQKERTVLKNADSPFSIQGLPQVFAALGTPEQGATINQIMKRTEFDMEKIHVLLENLQLQGLVTKQGMKYFSQFSHPSLQHLGEKSHFLKFIEGNLKQALEHLEHDYSLPHCLLFSSCLTIKLKDQERLKEELRSLLLKYVDESDVPDGEKVITLTCSLR